jgi:hypothetical protein
MTYRLLLPTLLIVVAGCLDDTSGPSRKWTNDSPGVSFRIPTIDNIWPNEDQTSWSFDYTWHEDLFWTMVLYPDSTDVPPLPDWDEIFDLLEIPLIGDSVVSAHGTYSMMFDGQATSGAGVTAQNLQVGFVLNPTGAAISVVEVSAQAEFFRRLGTARPDLAAKLPAAVSAQEPGQTISARSPLLIHGGVWEKTSGWIGTYNDLEQRLGWQFLTDELKPGTEFTYQLIPSMTDNAFLHCRIERQFTVETRLGDLPGAIECLYLADFGVSRVTDVLGNIMGYTHPIIYGVVVYAPTVGPVYCHERPLADTTDLIGVGDMELVLDEFQEP